MSYACSLLIEIKSQPLLLSVFFRRVLALLRLPLTSDLRDVPRPTAVPSATGSRTETAGLRNTAEGRVREGMYVVILNFFCCALAVSVCSDERVMRMTRLRKDGHVETDDGYLDGVSDVSWGTYDVPLATAWRLEGPRRCVQGRKEQIANVMENRII